MYEGEVQSAGLTGCGSVCLLHPHSVTSDIDLTSLNCLSHGGWEDLLPQPLLAPAGE